MADDYGWATCLSPKPDGAFECAEPDLYRLIFDLRLLTQHKDVRIKELEAKLGIGQGEAT